MSHDNRTLDEVLSRLNRWKRPVVIGHVVPDADCLGSLFSVARVWSDNGAQVRVAMPTGSISQRLEFMVADAAVTFAVGDDFAQADGFIVIDTAKKERTLSMVACHAAMARTCS